MLTRLLVAFQILLGYLTGGESITRILPWGRISSLSIFDTYMASITTLSLLFLFFLILLIYTYLIAKKSFKESNKSNQGLLLSSYLVGGSAFLIFIIIYIGASVIIPLNRHFLIFEQSSCYSSICSCPFSFSQGQC